MWWTRVESGWRLVVRVGKLRHDQIHSVASFPDVLENWKKSVAEEHGLPQCNCRVWTTTA
jgi:hypothetical protein